MTDYTKATGSSGTMMIRDTGSVVEFWLKAGSGTYAYQMPWTVTIFGQTYPWRQFRFVSGGSWQRIDGWSVTTNQTVTFHLGATGTSGLGGPTDFTVNINRARVPDAPNAVNIWNITSTTVDANFSGNYDGGSPIIEWQLGYGTDPNGPQYFLGWWDGSAPTVRGLTPGTTYYFWARGRNSVGWGGWSTRVQVGTLRVPQEPSAGGISEITQTSMRPRFFGAWDGGTPIIEWQLGFGTNPGGPLDIWESYDIGGAPIVTPLTPGTQYYFWARGRNSVGWSGWSGVLSARTIAGARVKVGDVWREAIPYVNVNGVWRLARSWGRVAGSWRESL